MVLDKEVPNFEVKSERLAPFCILFYGCQNLLYNKFNRYIVRHTNWSNGRYRHRLNSVFEQIIDFSAIQIAKATDCFIACFVNADLLVHLIQELFVYGDENRTDSQAISSCFLV